MPEFRLIKTRALYQDDKIVPVTITKIDEQSWALCRCGMELFGQQAIDAHNCYLRVDISEGESH